MRAGRPDALPADPGTKPEQDRNEGKNAFRYEAFFKAAYCKDATRTKQHFAPSEMPQIHGGDLDKRIRDQAECDRRERYGPMPMLSVT